MSLQWRVVIELSEGAEDVLLVRPEDDPVELAGEFVAKHSLPEYAVLALADHIESQCVRPDAAAQQPLRSGTPGSRQPSPRHSHTPVITAKAQDMRRRPERFADLSERGAASIRSRRSRDQVDHFDAIPATRPFVARKVPGQGWGTTTHRRSGVAEEIERPGDRLYALAVSQRVSLEHRRRKAAEDSAEREAAALARSFKPRISKQASDIKRQYPAYLLPKQAPEFPATEELQMQECTFRPAVLDRKGKSRDSSGVFANLFHDAEDRDMRRRGAEEQMLCEARSRRSQPAAAARRDASSASRGKTAASPVVRLVRPGGASATFERLARLGAEHAAARRGLTPRKGAERA
eukprot:TRINITY_DN9618_c2_g1_i1.p1 TRINITY_DN9618_c2_g1~~TRINITY_DN9618_c2_g1_i1.p1  ORF type:complete len:387 (+),score=128.99 TRINITY_DN9618_c2_g1_i1:115-1161(+)